MKIHVHAAEAIGTFSTFRLNDPDILVNRTCQIASSKRFIYSLEQKRKFGDDVFAFIDEAYDELGGFRSFKDIDRFINDSYVWYITYDGPQPPEDELDISRVYVVSVYRKKYGLKMVGMARRKIARGDSSHFENSEVRTRANAALAAHIKFMADRGWGEVSDSLERWSFRVLGDKYVINPQYLIDNNIFKDIRIDIDDFHYSRPLRKGGPMLTKVAFGTVRI